MAHRKSGNVFRDGRMRRATLWAQIAPLRTNMAAGVAVLTSQLNAAALLLRPFTIVRTRGFLLVRSDQVAATEDYGAAMAYAVVSEQAAAIGVTAVPTPDTDRASDFFFVYEELHGELDGGSSGPTELGKYTAFDSKAMRKVDEDQTMVIVAENTADSTDAVSITEGGRFLIKLH